MQLTKEAVQAGIEAGLALTDPEAELLDVFRKHAGGIMVLRSLLQSIGSGQIGLQPLMQEDGKKKPPPGGSGKKVAKKKTSRKKVSKKKK